MGIQYSELPIPLSKMIIPNILFFLFEISNIYLPSTDEFSLYFKEKKWMQIDENCLSFLPPVPPACFQTHIICLPFC